MRALPVAGRELRVAARRRGTYWIRFGGAAAAVATAGVVLLATARERASERSQVLFLTLAGIAFLYCILSGVLTTSDCVSEEKRDGTLGLLFLTDLRGYDVVTGKMTAASVRAVSTLAAFVPVIGLSLMMGGVPADAVLQVSLTLFNTLFLSLSLGVLVSILARDARNAIGGTILALLVLVILLPLVRWICIEYLMAPATGPPTRASSFFGAASRPVDWPLLVNPALLWLSAVQSMFGFAPRAATDFWIALGAQHALAWFALLVGFVVLPRIWQVRAEAGTVSVSGAEGGTGRSRLAELRSEVLDETPFAWMVLRERRTLIATWAGLGLIGAGWFWGYWEVKEDWLAGVVGLTTIFFAGLWLKLRLASTACRHLHEHRRTGALELILCTPQQPGLLIRDNLAGLRQAFGPPLAVVLAAAGILLVAALGQDVGGSDQGELLWAFGAGLGVLVLDLWTLAWTGMWQGARTRRYVRAYGWTVGGVLTLPWVIFIVSLILMMIVGDVLGLFHSWDPSTHTLILWWAAVAVGVDVLLLALARRRLPEVLREDSAGGGASSSGRGVGTPKSGATPESAPGSP